jgi:hypothetical protein
VILGPIVGVTPRSRGKTCTTSPTGLPESGSGCPRSSNVAGVVDKVFVPTCRFVGLLEGRVHMIGTSETLIGGDPWVPMSLTWEAVPK